ncbi:hemin uptake protein HemP [Chitinimonas naiadis]
MSIETKPPLSKPLPVAPAPVIDVATLMGKHAEISIRHRGETYRLRLTRNGKLILTK